jgi:Ca-activated chloride channel family protein
MNRIKHLSAGIFAIALCCFSLSGQAQESKNDDSNFSLSVDVELVQLPVSVFDRDGRVVEGLTKSDFHVFEGGVQQQISFFKHEDIPLSVALVIDNSGSMHNKRERVNSAALTFARESNPQDETFIVNFDDMVYLEQDFTGSMDDLINALSNLDTRGETALYDAVYLSSAHLEEGKKDKKAILLISDGEDNKSQFSMNKAVEALRQSKVTLYAIGLLDEDNRGFFNKSPSKKARSALQKFAEVTGGQAYFPESLSEIEGLCKRIAHDLRSQYTVGYTPMNRNRDGSWRDVTVKVDPPKNLKNVIVRTKPGYYAPRVPAQ